MIKIERNKISDFTFKARSLGWDRSITLNSSKELTSISVTPKDVIDDLGTIWKWSEDLSVWIPQKPVLEVEVKEEMDISMFEDPLKEEGIYSFLSNSRRYYGDDCFRKVDGHDLDFWYEAYGSSTEMFFEKNGYIAIKVYMYEHSGRTISTAPFNNQWDSGLLGYLYIKEDEVEEKIGKKMTKDEVLEDMRSFVNISWKQYIEGDYYYYEISDRTTYGNFNTDIISTGYRFDDAEGEAKKSIAATLARWDDIYSKFLQKVNI